MLLRRMSIADGLTVTNGLCGLAAIIVALSGTRVLALHGRGESLSEGRLLVCAALIVTGGIVDLFDGVVARRRGNSGLGTELDVMSDILTFAVAPAAVLIASSVSEPIAYRVVTVLVAASFVIAAMMRLARHATAVGLHETGFCGLPVPPASLATLAVIQIHSGWLLTLVTVFVLACLMVSNLAYPHPNLLGLVALTVYLAATYAALATEVVSHTAVLILGLAVILGPILVSALRPHSHAAKRDPAAAVEANAVSLIAVGDGSARPVSH